MEKDIEKKSFDFVLSRKIDKNSKHYCETRDIFQARLDKMLSFLLNQKQIKEDDVYILSAIVGEIGNNSFDHNVGSWKSIMGVFFAYYIDDYSVVVALADAGQGIFNTLKKVKADIENDKEALKVAFNEKISGREPESRGNGLKFVKKNIKDRGMHLEFVSGKAKIELNNIEKITESDKRYDGCVAIINLKIHED